MLMWPGLHKRLVTKTRRKSPSFTLNALGSILVCSNSLKTTDGDAAIRCVPVQPCLHKAHETTLPVVPLTRDESCYSNDLIRRWPPVGHDERGETRCLSPLLHKPQLSRPISFPPLFRFSPTSSACPPPDLSGDFWCSGWQACRPQCHQVTPGVNNAALMSLHVSPSKSKI